MREQDIARSIWNSGCYFLSILYCADQLDSAFGLYKTFVKEGWMEEDCYIKDPASIMSYLFPNKYSITKSVGVDDKADFNIAYYYNPSTKYHHFVVVDKQGNVIYDPLGESNTVKNGYPESYRCFYKIPKTNKEILEEASLRG